MFSCSRFIVLLFPLHCISKRWLYIHLQVRWICQGCCDFSPISFKYRLWIVTSFALGKRPVEVKIASYWSWSAVKFVRNNLRVRLCHIEIYLVLFLLSYRFAMQIKSTTFLWRVFFLTSNYPLLFFKPLDHRNAIPYTL